MEEPLPPPPLPDSAGTKLTGASITMLIATWLVWLVVLFSYPLDVFSFYLAEGEPGETPDRGFVGVLGIVAFTNIVMVFFFRWLFFRFLIHEKRLRPGGWAGACVGIIGVLLVYGLIKAIETYGLILLLQSTSWPHYFGFAIPSLVVLLICLPAWMLNRNVTRHVPLPEESGG